MMCTYICTASVAMMMFARVLLGAAFHIPAAHPRYSFSPQGSPALSFYYHCSFERLL